jgi:hypothetical protein
MKEILLYRISTNVSLEKVTAGSGSRGVVNMVARPGGGYTLLL